MTNSPRWTVSSGSRRQLRQSAAEQFLVHLGQFPAHQRGAVAQDLMHVRQRFPDPVRRLVEHQRAIIVLKLPQRLPPLALFRRQEALEHEPVGGQPADAQRGGGRGHSRNRRHRHPVLGRRPDQVIARVRDRRRARVRHQRDVLAGFQPLHQRGGLGPFVAVMIAGEGCVDLVPGEQLPGVPGIFRRDEVYLPQHAQGAQRDILQVADGRSHHVKHRQFQPLPLWERG